VDALLNFSPQLYHYLPGNSAANNRVPEQIASGVLFTTGESYFLLTAKHVFKDRQINDIIIFLVGDAIVGLGGDIGYFIVDKEYDNLDIAILKLNIEVSEKLKTRYLFLHVKNLDFTHTYDPANFYMMLGYINKQTVLTGQTFSATPFAFLTQIKRFKRINSLGLTDAENITLRYNRRKQAFYFDDKIQFGPKDLRGLSGGGIWYCKKDKTTDKMYFSLVGIMIEHIYGKNRGIVVGTKIRLAAEILMRHFGE
jgi:hypothetical protein